MACSPRDSTATASLHFPNGPGGLRGWPWLRVPLLVLSQFGNGRRTGLLWVTWEDRLPVRLSQTSTMVKVQMWTFVYVRCQVTLSIHAVNNLVIMHLVNTMVLREEWPGHVWDFTCMKILGRCWTLLNRFRSSEKILPSSVGRAWLQRSGSQSMLLAGQNTDPTKGKGGVTTSPWREGL